MSDAPLITLPGCFYNIVHGENEYADVLLSVLGLRREQIPRYRDCWWTGEAIALHTRTGGTNRIAHEAANAALARLPHYLRDEDELCDATYATFYFRVPEGMEWALARVRPQRQSPTERWKEKLALLGDPAQKEHPEVVRILTALQPVINRLSAGGVLSDAD